MKESRESYLKTLAQGEPFLKSILAFFIFLRFGGIGNSGPCIDDAHLTANKFIKRLKDDLK